MKLFLQDISKSYGTNPALRQVSAELDPGIYALLGPNGSGKSTLMNIITDNLAADHGTISYCGDREGAQPENVRNMGVRFREKLGFMPQYPGMYPNFTVERFLWYMAALKDMGRGLQRKEKKQYIAAQIERMVWNVPVCEADVVRMQQQFRVTNISRSEEAGTGGKIILRVLAEEQPTPDAKTTAPTLEDYYLRVFGQEASV